MKFNSSNLTVVSVACHFHFCPMFIMTCLYIFFFFWHFIKYTFQKRSTVAVTWVLRTLSACVCVCVCVHMHTAIVIPKSHNFSFFVLIRPSLNLDKRVRLDTIGNVWLWCHRLDQDYTWILHKGIKGGGQERWKRSSESRNDRLFCRCIQTSLVQKNKKVTKNILCGRLVPISSI